MRLANRTWGFVTGLALLALAAGLFAGFAAWGRGDVATAEETNTERTDSENGDGRVYNQPSQPITGYHVTHTVNAKVRNLDSAGAVIEAAGNAGANNIQNVWF